MIIRCWGARGSIPVSGKKYLKYGGDTTCIEIRSKKDEIIIIDAGSGLRRLGSRLVRENRLEFTMVFTHAHWDHLMGFPFFTPIYLSKTRISVHGCPFAQASVKRIISPSMKPPNFPVRFQDIRAKIRYHKICTRPYTVAGIKVRPILLSHPNKGIGYRFEEDKKSFVFLTDNELAYRHPGGLDYEDYMKFSKGADLLIHDSEFTRTDYKKKKMWGHSVYNDSLRLAMEAGVKQFGLFHHNQERSDRAVDAIARDCRKIIRKKRSGLKCFAVAEDMEIKL
jgi:phosphoribosyl 1,2-cyclic phosphodiesterase